jgi:hypothetical protein
MSPAEYEIKDFISKIKKKKVVFPYTRSSEEETIIDALCEFTMELSEEVKRLRGIAESRP